MSSALEVAFVEWSKAIDVEDYDVVYVSKVLGRFNGRPIHGLDVGGGIGKFASHICGQVPNCTITVVDNSSLAKNNFISDKRIRLVYEDFFVFDEQKRYDFIIFKTVLHHFVSNGENETEALQRAALSKSLRLLTGDGCLIIEENFYEGVFDGDLTGRIIFFLTKLQKGKSLFRRLGANTAGEGVRFRNFMGWKSLLNELGFAIFSSEKHGKWEMPLWQRIPLLCKRRYQAVLAACRKDSPY